MNQVKRILLFVAILTIWTGHRGFAAVQKTPDQKESGSAPSAPSMTAPGATDKTFNEPKNQSILSQLPAPPSDNEPTPQYRRQEIPPDCVPGNPNCPTTPDPDCIPGYPNCPTIPVPTPAYTYPVANVCPSGYYCRPNLIPILGAREGVQKLCTRNETELEDTYRDCDKVIALCQRAKPSIMSEAHYRGLCS